MGEWIDNYYFDIGLFQAAYGLLPKKENEMHKFESGAVRGECYDARYDLIPAIALKRLALRYGLGSKKYGDRNWEKGLPFSDTFNHIIEHLIQYKTNKEFHLIQKDDDLAGAMWGIAALMFFDFCEEEKLKPLTENFVIPQD